MIYDLDAGRPERASRSSLRMTAVTIVAVGMALVFFTALAFAPRQRETQTPILTLSAALPTIRPTLLSGPVPDRTLWLSPDVARVTHSITNSGFTGLIPSDSLMTTYELVASGDLVSVAWLFPEEVLPYPAPAPADARPRVRGHEANSLIAANGTTSIRWLESEMVFELSSRTLTVDQLVDLANQLR